jgi:hypothetical protein
MLTPTVTEIRRQGQRVTSVAATLPSVAAVAAVARRAAA